MITLCEFVSTSQELVTRGGISISDGRWRELADLSGVPPATLERVLDIWVKGDDRTPPFLRSPGENIYTLSDAHQDIFEFLVAGAKKRVAGRKAGRRGRKRRETRF